MIALEAIREALVKLDTDITSLEGCIEDNKGVINTNLGGIEGNDVLILANDDELEVQQARLEAL